MFSLITSVAVFTLLPSNDNVPELNPTDCSITLKIKFSVSIYAAALISGAKS